MIICRFSESLTSPIIAEVLALSASTAAGLNSTTEFSCEIPYNFPNALSITEGSTVVATFDGDEIFEGIVQKVSRAQGANIQITALSRLDKLFDTRSFPFAYYENTPLVAALVELLEPIGWSLGDVSTLADPDQPLTIDLREKENRLTQLAEIFTSVPAMFYRQGASVLGRPTLDVGVFYKKSGKQVLQKPDSMSLMSNDPNTHWIKTLTYGESSDDRIVGIRALGGDARYSNVDRAVNLGDLLSLTPSLLYDLNYPIIEDHAEFSYITYSKSMYGRIGGTVISTPKSEGVAIIGDNAGGGAELNVWQAITFVPFPGKLESFSLRFTIAVGVTTEQVTWVLQEIDTTDTVTVLAELATGTFDALSSANQIVQLRPSVDVELEAGKLYAIAYGFDFNPAPDIMRLTLPTQTLNNSYSFKMRSNSSGKITTGGAWTASTTLCFLEVVTSPLDEYRGGFITETASRFAPPNTGDNSTLSQMQSAGKSLYQWAIAYLQDRVPSIRTFETQVEASTSLPKPGDSVYVESRAYGSAFNPATGRPYTTTMEVAGDLRVDKVSTSYTGVGVDVSYSLINGSVTPRTDGIAVPIFDKIKSKKNSSVTKGPVPTRPWSMTFGEISHAVSAQVGNTYLSSGRRGVAISIPIYSGTITSRPTNAASVYLAGLPFGELDSGGELDVELLAFPTYENPTVEIKISPKLRDWVYGDTTTLTVYLVWR